MPTPVLGATTAIQTPTLGIKCSQRSRIVREAGAAARVAAIAPGRRERDGLGSCMNDGVRATRGAH